MFKLIAFVAICAVVIQADPVPFKCGEYPWMILRCIHMPQVITRDVVDQCRSGSTECENSNCIYEKMGWMNEDKVIDQLKLVARYDEIAKEYPLWADTIAAIKTECLAGNLPALGTQLNCPSYDAFLCVLKKFFKDAKPSQWKTEAECEAPRQFVANCPICPRGCVAPYPENLCKQCKA